MKTSEIKDTIDPNSATERATFGGGCFWCMEAVFEKLYGVKSVTSGYAGGHVENPTYQQVCSHTTGHAEVVQIAFDPKKISFDDLLGLFWEAHDPTALNRQGNDSGPQYRSIILCENDAQKQAAEKFQVANRDGNRAFEKILFGGGLSSGLLPQQSKSGLLFRRDPPKS